MSRWKSVLSVVAAVVVAVSLLLAPAVATTNAASESTLVDCDGTSIFLHKIDVDNDGYWDFMQYYLEGDTYPYIIAIYDGIPDHPAYVWINGKMYTWEDVLGTYPPPDGICKVPRVPREKVIPMPGNSYDRLEI